MIKELESRIKGKTLQDMDGKIYPIRVKRNLLPPLDAFLWVDKLPIPSAIALKVLDFWESNGNLV